LSKLKINYKVISSPVPYHKIRFLKNNIDINLIESYKFLKDELTLPNFSIGFETKKLVLNFSITGNAS